MALELYEFLALFQRLSVASLCYTKEDVKNALKVAHSLQQFSHRLYLRRFEEHQGRPALISYLGDAWGAFVSEQVALTYPGSHVRATRHGKYRHEFLLQRAMYRFDKGTGEQIVGQVFAEPVGLSDGKTAMHCFVGACDFLSTTRHPSS